MNGMNVRICTMHISSSSSKPLGFSGWHILGFEFPLSEYYTMEQLRIVVFAVGSVAPAHANNRERFYAFVQCTNPKSRVLFEFTYVYHMHTEWREHSFITKPRSICQTKTEPDMCAAVSWFFSRLVAHLVSR